MEGASVEVGAGRGRAGGRVLLEVNVAALTHKLGGALRVAELGNKVRQEGLDVRGAKRDRDVLGVDDRGRVRLQVVKRSRGPPVADPLPLRIIRTGSLPLAVHGRIVVSAVEDVELLGRRQFDNLILAGP